MTDPDTTKLVMDLMTKARSDSEVSLQRNIDLLMSTAGKDHVFNIVRAGFTPYLEILMELFPPEMVAAHVAYMIMQLKHGRSGGKIVPNLEEAMAMSNVLMGILKPVMNNILENFPHYKPDEKKYQDRA